MLRVLREHGVKLIASKVADVNSLREFVSVVRAVKSQANMATRRDSVITLVYKDAASQKLVTANQEKLCRLAGLASINPAADLAGRPGSLTSVGTLALELAGQVDVGAEKIRLQKELEKLAKAVASGEAKLSNEAFVSKAPPTILAGAKKQLDEAKAQHAEIARMLASLG